MKGKRAAIYLRVSTLDQKTDLQEAELKEYVDRRGWELAQIYCDKGFSGAKDSRPALDLLMADCGKGKLDIVCVWKFDRFARSATHLLRALENFKALGVEFCSFTEQLDTSTPTGKMSFTVLSAVAELERSVVAERVRAGLRNAKAKGKRLGRPALRYLTEKEEALLRRDKRRGGLSLRAVAAKYGVSLWKAHALCSAK